jgi:hypothetical protein
LPGQPFVERCQASAQRMGGTDDDDEPVIQGLGVGKVSGRYAALVAKLS